MLRNERQQYLTGEGVHAGEFFFSALSFA
ncbi:MAG: hypothetical protein TR69_WS6001001504, partial [candidate division WS6 bacterium OLB20]